MLRLCGGGGGGGGSGAHFSTFLLSSRFFNTFLGSCHFFRKFSQRSLGSLGSLGSLCFSCRLEFGDFFVHGISLGRETVHLFLIFGDGRSGGRS
jgi:hypothetical protein